MRNVPTLFGRADSHFTSYFWDGKVQLTDEEITSPIGLRFDDGVNSLLAVASILPFLSRDEFLGRHSLFNNTLLDSVNPFFYSERLRMRNEQLQQQFKNEETVLENSLKDFGIKSTEVDFIFIGNAIAQFIQSLNSSCKKSSWEEYIDGNTSALSPIQKQGAVLFFSKGRCAACHYGSHFSDFKFHSIGFPKFEFGPYLFNDDIGLAETSFELSDRYKFRTPPLVKISETGPYGHNGIFDDLKGVIYYHITPVIYFRDKPIEKILSNSQAIESRSNLLQHINLSESEIDLIVEFLKSL